MIIGLDHGYGAIKGSSGFVMTTGIKEYENEPYTTKNTIKYNGKYYVCGSGRQTLVKDKTENDSYYILTLAAIAKELIHRGAGNKANIILAVGLPLTGYSKDKSKFIAYLMRNGSQPIEFEFEKTEYKIYIEEVLVYPQGYVAVNKSNSQLLTQPSVIICDFGSWTVDVFRMDNERPNVATCRSHEMGIIRMMDIILEEVRSSTGLSITTAQIESVMKNIPCIVDEKAKTIIQNKGKEYIDILLRTLLESGFDIKAIPTVFLGGGAAIVEKNVDRERYAKMEFITDITANAKAFEIVAKRIKGSRM